MAIAFGSVSSYASTTLATTATIPKPASVAAGDLLFMAAINSNPTNFATPTGWTLLDANANVLSYGFCSVAYWYKIATGSEPTSYTLTMGAAANPTVVITRYTGVDTTNPIISHALAVGGSGTKSPAAPTLTGVVAGVMVVNAYNWANNTGTDAATQTMPASPWTTRVNTGTPVGGGGYNVDIGVTDQVNPSTHPTVTARASGGLWGVESVALAVATATPPSGPPPAQFSPFFAGVAAGSQVDVPTAPFGQSGMWTNIFADEFPDTTLDTTKWSPTRDGNDYGGDTPFTGTTEAAWYKSGNVSVSGGLLSLSVNNNDPKTLGGHTYPYSGATLCTIDRFAFGPGSFLEGRMKLSTLSGGWPAFWAVPQDGSYPPEFDVFEFFNTSDALNAPESGAKPQFNYHDLAGGQTGPSPYGGSTDYRDTWHVYGMWWKTDGSLVPYLDGVAYPSAGAPAGTVVPTMTQFIILDMAIAAGNPAPANGVAMQVDWIRVWQ